MLFLMPLRSAEYHIEIVNLIANFVTQKYYNPTDQFLAVENHFPINPDVCIYRFTAQFEKIKV